MFAKCPKCGAPLPQASPELEQCPACGLVFRKYLQVQAQLEQAARAAPEVAAVPAGSDAEHRRSLLASLLYVPDEAEPWRVYAEAIVLAASVYLGVRFWRMDIPEWEMAGTFFHGAMVPFHEFGHLLFRPFGEFMTLAGGSLAQWLMPLGFLVFFSFRNRDNFAAALMLWWCGTQWIDLAPYAYDALRPQHVLLSGRTGDSGGHDYIDILYDLGLLEHAHGVARLMHEVGLLLMLLAWAWGGYIVWRKFKARART